MHFSQSVWEPVAPGFLKTEAYTRERLSHQVLPSVHCLGWMGIQSDPFIALVLCHMDRATPIELVFLLGKGNARKPSPSMGFPSFSDY